MNKQEMDILNILIKEPYINQRALAEDSGHSLGSVNKATRNLLANGFLDKDMHITQKAVEMIERFKPRNAIILAAGYGMRMVPISTEVSKGLLEVHGEPLIERLIKQLHEANVLEIHIVVGFQKEQYEYLMDKYGVNLIVNPEYSIKNNLYSLKKAVHLLGNTYIVPCDLWCSRNPFSKYELCSWYMVNDLITDKTSVKVNRNWELIRVSKDSMGNGMVGISYLLKEDAGKVKENVLALCQSGSYDNAFWEEALYEKQKMFVYARVIKEQDVVEINTYEQLRDLDENSKQLKSEVLDEIVRAMGIRKEQICGIRVLKKGMTNRSFLFRVDGQKYIMRIPGEGTDQLINRAQEAEVYEKLNGKHICDDVVYINPETGYKITRYLTDARVCDPNDWNDVELCMKRLRQFHTQKLEVAHMFDPFVQLEFYEKLWGDGKSVYKDYESTKEKVLSLKEYIDAQPKEVGLAHIDAVPDNFLFVTAKNNKRDIRLIDWEYAGMQDTHIDIAMFAIYAMYDREQIDKLIDLYFDNQCSKVIRLKIYCYIAVCGLLWSNWCEYKSRLGVEFGEYSLRQYRYAKEFYRIFKEEV